MNIPQLRQYIIQPVLRHIGHYSQAAENLLVMTACQESLAGEYIHQLGSGPALGIYEMEPATHDDIYNNYIKYHGKLLQAIQDFDLPGFAGQGVGSATEMCGNNYYATAMCRVHYLRVPERLPDANDVDGLAAYYKKYYNTEQGAARVADVIRNYTKYA